MPAGDLEKIGDILAQISEEKDSDNYMNLAQTYSTEDQVLFNFADVLAQLGAEEFDQVTGFMDQATNQFAQLNSFLSD